MKRHYGFRGFTLIELLVSMAIILILVALLLPVLESARKRSKLSACMGNMRQFGVSFHGFKHDHEERLPVAVPVAEGGVKEVFFFPGPTIGSGWMTNDVRIYQAMSNLLGAPRILICPADKWHVPVDRFDDLKPISNTRQPNLSYSALVSFIGRGEGPKTIYAGDSAGDRKHLDEYTPSFAGEGEKLAVLLLPGNHRELGGNWLFGDGRVDRIPPPDGSGSQVDSMLRLPP